MTTGQGQMRETYPFAGATYRYRTEEDDRRFTFSLEGDDPTGAGSVHHPGNRSRGDGRRVVPDGIGANRAICLGLGGR